MTWFLSGAIKIMGGAFLPCGYFSDKISLTGQKAGLPEESVPEGIDESNDSTPPLESSARRGRAIFTLPSD